MQISLNISSSVRTGTVTTTSHHPPFILHLRKRINIPKTSLRTFTAHTDCSAPCWLLGTFGLGFYACAFSLTIASEGSRSSLQEPKPGSRRLYAGHHLDSKQVASRFIPDPYILPGFDVI